MVEQKACRLVEEECNCIVRMEEVAGIPMPVREVWAENGEEHVVDDRIEVCWVKYGVLELILQLCNGAYRGHPQSCWLVLVSAS